MSVTAPQETWDEEYQLHDNIAVDLVNYVRSGTIRNEQQFLLIMAALATGLLENPKSYLSFVVIGTAGSGKTHTYEEAKELLHYLDIYATTSGSAKSMIYDEEWDEADLAMLDELQKPPEELIEFLKSVHGGDGEMSYKVTQGSAQEGFSTKEINRDAKVYGFLYAQHDADMEMWDRLLKIPIHESESKNRAVGAMAFDHSHIKLGEDSYEYGYPFEAGEQRLKEHFASIKANAPKRVAIPDGSAQFNWDCWEVVKPIFAHGRSEANRIYQMVANTIRGFTLMNYQNRETMVVDGEEYLVAEPQDVANLLRCREALLATTHEIDDKKRALAESIRAKSGDMNEVQGVKPILEFLEESDAPTVKESELTNLIGDLKENYIVDVHEGKDETVYEFLGWDDLGLANVARYQSAFEGTIDPMTGDSFLDFFDDQRDRLQTHADDLLKKANIEAGSSHADSDESGGLSDFGAGVDEEPAVELGPVERVVGERVADTADGERIEDLSDVPIEALLGMTSLDNPAPVVGDVTGTLLDADNELWDQPNHDDKWVSSKSNAKRELRRAFEDLISKGCIDFATIHETDASGTPVDAELSVTIPDTA
ncbi:hypothetical protein [Halosegnis longus]|uniref:hypothetical protein n=1 Tax=Halosegnis longus TaxID=2216012 RepID=UPI00129D4D8B|nr:hypothetical protein [Halosegnis longus]